MRGTARCSARALNAEIAADARRRQQAGPQAVVLERLISGLAERRLAPGDRDRLEWIQSVVWGHLERGAEPSDEGVTHTLTVLSEIETRGGAYEVVTGRRHESGATAGAAPPFADQSGDRRGG
jgi:hypothetical protein